MSADGKRVVDLLRQISAAENELRGIINSTTRREVAADLGEWIGAQILGCKMAKSSIQKGWDLISESGLRVQVRTERKSKTNSHKGRFFLSHKELDGKDRADMFLWITMNPDRTVNCFYLVERERVESLGKRNDDGWTLSVKALDGYKLQAADERIRNKILFEIIQVSRNA